MNQRSELLPGGFVQLLPILQWVVTLHMEQIEAAARGSLAQGICTPSEEKAVECVIRMFEGRYEEDDRRLIEEYMAVRTWEWWRGYPEEVRGLLSDLVMRADRRKNGWVGPKDGRRPPNHCEGVRIARPLLAGIPKSIRLDVEGEYEGVVQVLAFLLWNPAGEPSPEMLQRYRELSKSSLQYRESIKRHYEDVDNGMVTLPMPTLRWQPEAPFRVRRRHPKVKVPSHRPVTPATLRRGLQSQLVIGLLDRLGISPRGIKVSGCRVVAEVLGLDEDTVIDIWEMRFTEAMRKYARAIAERHGPFHTD